MKNNTHTHAYTKTHLMKHKTRTLSIPLRSIYIQIYFITMQHESNKQQQHQQQQKKMKKKKKQQNL